jgi:hypothetical protein
MKEVKLPSLIFDMVKWKASHHSHLTITLSKIKTNMIPWIVFAKNNNKSSRPSSKTTSFRDKSCCPTKGYYPISRYRFGICSPFNPWRQRVVIHGGWWRNTKYYKYLTS